MGGQKISRRTSLVAASGLLMIGSGLGAVLVAPGAHAAEGTKFLLKLHKHVGKKKKLVGTIELTDELLEKLAAAGEGTLSLQVEQETDKGKKIIGDKQLPDGAKLVGAVKKAKHKPPKKK